MPGRAPCHNCGGRVDVPSGHARPKIRCPHCGYYAEVPPDLRAAAATADEEPPSEPRPRPAKKAAPAVIDPGPNLLDGTQDEDDDRPYAVPGDGTKKCPACRKELPVGATFCVHCGGDLTAGRKQRRTFQPVGRTWESRWPLRTRLAVFLGLQGLNLLAIVVMEVFGNGVGGIGLTTILFNTAMQAFLVGSYETLTVKRNAKGQAWLTKTWRVAFVPKPPDKVDWKKSHAVGIITTHQAGLMEWGMFLYLIICTGCPPVGFLFYFLAIRPERFDVALTDEYGSTDAVVFRTTDRAVAEEVGSVIADCTGLWYRPVL